MTQLPVAEGADVRRAAAGLVRTDRRSFAVVLGLNALAALAGLAGPWLLGRIVDEVRGGGGVGAVDRMALAILLCSLAQLLLARWARYVGHRFGSGPSPGCGSGTWNGRWRCPRRSWSGRGPGT